MSDWSIISSGADANENPAPSCDGFEFIADLDHKPNVKDTEAVSTTKDPNASVVEWLKGQHIIEHTWSFEVPFGELSECRPPSDTGLFTIKEHPSTWYQSITSKQFNRDPIMHRIESSLRLTENPADLMAMVIWCYFLKHTVVPRHRCIYTAILRCIKTKIFPDVEEIVLKVQGSMSLLETAIAQDKMAENRSIIRSDTCYFSMSPRMVFRPLEWEEGETKYKAATPWRKF